MHSPCPAPRTLPSARLASSVALPVALGLALALAGCGEAPPARTLQGYAEGEYVYVASPYAGQLERLEVARGDQAAAGATLFVLESGVEQGAVDAASARIRAARARLVNLGEGRRADEVDVLRSQVVNAQAALRLSTIQLDQAQRLAKDGFVSQARLDEARASSERDRAQLAQAEAQLRVGLSSLGRTPELQAARAEIEAAQADLDQARTRLAQKTGLAPAAGLVADTYFRQGEWVPAGSPVLALLPPENIKVRFFVPEPALGSVAVGQALRVTCDGCGEPIPARVSFVSTQAEYTPPVIYSRESRAKLVFLVEARPAPADARRLKPGQPVEVERAQR